MNTKKGSKYLIQKIYGEQLSDNVNSLSQKILSIDEELYTLKMVSAKIKENPNRLDIYRLIPENGGQKKL